ncbi:MAG: hypothetical protein SVR94_08610 [Pseudomonadota bacterium]|nr:hypothetical protein [Pseudomonadota bacterium]
MNKLLNKPLTSHSKPTQQEQPKETDPNRTKDFFLSKSNPPTKELIDLDLLRKAA